MRKPRHKKVILLQLKGWEKLELRLESGILASEPTRTVSRQGREGSAEVCRNPLCTSSVETPPFRGDLHTRSGAANV